MKLQQFLFMAIVTMLLPRQPVVADIIFSDGTFNNSDWAETKITNSIATVSAPQQPTGVNPGQYRRVDHLNFDDLLYVMHLRGGAIVVPNLAPITTINFSVDEIAILNLNGVGVDGR